MSAVAESFLRPIVAFRTFENLFHNRGRIGVPQCGLDRTQTNGAIGFSAFQGDSVLTSETLEFYIGHRMQNLSSGKVFCQFLLQRNGLFRIFCIRSRPRRGLPLFFLPQTGHLHPSHRCPSSRIAPQTVHLQPFQRWLSSRIFPQTVHLQPFQT